jgi:hypothetical protein
VFDDLESYIASHFTNARPSISFSSSGCHWLLLQQASSSSLISKTTSSVVDHGFVLRSGKTKDNNIVICRISAQDAALRSKSKNMLARNQDNVSEWSAFLPMGCCISQLALKNIKLSVFV